MDMREQPKVVRKLFSLIYPICLGLAAICASSAARHEPRSQPVPSSLIKGR